MGVNRPISIFLAAAIFLAFACGSRTEKSPDTTAEGKSTTQGAVTYFNNIKTQLDPLKKLTEDLNSAILNRKISSMDDNFSRLESQLFKAIDYINTIEGFEGDDLFRQAAKKYLEFNKETLYLYFSPLIAEAKDVINGVSTLTSEDWDRRIEEEKERVIKEANIIEEFQAAEKKFASLYGFKLQVSFSIPAFYKVKGLRLRRMR